MKKTLALVLAVALLISVTSAFAAGKHYKVVEDFETLDVELDIPEGYEYKQNPEEGLICLELTDPTGKLPFFDMHVAPGDEYEDKSLADLTDGEKAQYIEMAIQEFENPETELFTTPSGNQILLAKENGEACQFATMQTIYKGFFFYLYCGYPDFHELSDADMALMHQVLESVQIIRNAK